jgi:hypothetical protein
MSPSTSRLQAAVTSQAATPGPYSAVPGPATGLVEPPPPQTTPNSVDVVWPGRMVGADEVVIAAKLQPVAVLNFYNNTTSTERWSVDVDVTGSLGQPSLSVQTVMSGLDLPGAVYLASRTTPSRVLHVTLSPGGDRQVVTWDGTATDGTRLLAGRYELAITAQQSPQGSAAAAFTKEVIVQ